MRKRIVLGFVLMSGLWLTGILAAQATAGSVDILNVATMHAQIPSLDPHVQASTERYICYMSYEPLVGREKGGLKLIPKLATKWEGSKDAKTFTFYLRKGVKFHDGTEFDANAVRFNFERMSNLKKGFYWMLAPLEKVEVVDRYTVRFTMNTSFALFPNMIEYFPIVSPKSVLDHEEKKGDFAAKWYTDHGVGTGPYKFIEWKQGEKIVHEKFDNYWGGWKGNHCKRVVNWLIPESGTQRMMLEKGDMDIILDFTPDDFLALKKNPNISAEEFDSISIMFLKINCVAPPTNDARVRKALSYCFNRIAYEQVAGGRVPLPDGPVAASQLDGWKPKNLILEYNPAKAKSMLAEAGYPNGFEISCMVQSDVQLARIIAEVWQAGLAEAGVKLNIKLMPYAAIDTQCNKWAIERNPATAEHSLIQYITPTIQDAYGYLFRVYHTKAQPGQPGSGRNRMLYSNPKVDALIDSAATVLDSNQRKELYKEAVQMIVDDCPDIWTERLIERVLMRKVVKGYYIDYLYLGSVPYFDVYKTGP